LIGDFLIFRAGRIHPRDRSSRAREAFEIRGRTLAMRRNRRAAEQAKSYIASDEGDRRPYRVSGKGDGQALEIAQCRYHY